MCACCAIRPNAAAPSSPVSPIPKKPAGRHRAAAAGRASWMTSPAPHRGEDLEIRITVAAAQDGRAGAAGLARARTAAWAGQHHRECRRFRPFAGARSMPAGMRAVPARCRSTMTAPASRRRFSSASASPTSPRAPAITPWGKPRLGPVGALDQHEGMGLGFFIAKILLEQTGGVVKAVNPARRRGAGLDPLAAGRDRRARAASPDRA